MAGTFGFRRFGPGFKEFDWYGDQVLATVVEASRRAINDVTEEGVRIAREEHPWKNQTFQTQNSLFRNEAIIEGPPLRVWGEWGVVDVPRYKVDEEGNLTDEEERTVHGGVERTLTTKDVALFLEFGTVETPELPWLYPAYDRTKITLAAKVGAYYRELETSGAPTAIRSSLGRFLPHDILVYGE